MHISATAPTRVDLVGGTLDIWPIYLQFPGACTINFAINCHTRADLVVRDDACIILRSSDNKVEETYASYKELCREIERSELRLVAQVVRFFAPPMGLEITTSSHVPIGSGLAGSSSLMVALCSAFNTLLERRYSPYELIGVAKNIESIVIKKPAGMQDYFPAMFGGLLSINLDVDKVSHTMLDTDIAWIEKYCLLWYSGASHHSGMNNWDVMKRFYDGETAVSRCFEGIVAASQGVKSHLLNHDINALAADLEREWMHRKGLSPTICTDLIQSLTEKGSQCKSLASRVCGAGGGGVVLFVIDPEHRAQLITELKMLGGCQMEFRIDTQGVQIHSENARAN